MPPHELRLHNPKRDGLLPTPVDERGIVDVKKLITNVKATIEPEYRWKSLTNDVHHLQWPSNRYADAPDADLDPQEFRNLAVSKLIVPRVFHNWTHHITEPPPVPSDEMMHYRIEAQRVAIELFQTIRSSRFDSRDKSLTDEELEQRLIRHFETFSTKLELARLAIPSEFQLIDFTDYQPKDYHDMYKISSKIGRAALVPTIVRQLTRPA